MEAMEMFFQLAWGQISLRAQANYTHSPQQRRERIQHHNRVFSMKNLFRLIILSSFPLSIKSAEVKSIFFFKERERSTNTAQWTLSWQTLKQFTGPNKSPSEQLVSDKVKVIKRAEYIMNKTTPVHSILNLIYTAGLVDFWSVVVSFCK